MIFRTAALIASAAIATTACQDRTTAPQPLSVNTIVADRSTGDTPNYNLEFLLRPAGATDGFGHVKFRQAQDNNPTMQRIDLGVWVRDLAPNTEYLLQRAVDTNLDGVCTGTNWLTLGEGSASQSITTDSKGSATQDLFRVLTFAPGTTFDIIMRVVREDDPAQSVLISDCYQFTVK